MTFLVYLANKTVIYREPNQPVKENTSSTGPILVVVQTLHINEEVRQFANSIIASGTNASVIVISSDGSFGNVNDVQELNANETYKVIHCDSKISTSLVFSVIAYSQNDRVAIMNWNAIVADNDEARSLYPNTPSRTPDAPLCLRKSSSNQKRAASTWESTSPPPFAPSSPALALPSNIVP